MQEGCVIEASIGAVTGLGDNAKHSRSLAQFHRVPNGQVYRAPQKHHRTRYCPAPITIETCALKQRCATNDLAANGGARAGYRPGPWLNDFAAWQLRSTAASHLGRHQR